MSYPDQARYVAAAAARIGAAFEDLDGGSGHLFRVARDGRAWTGAVGLGLCPYPINSAAAVTLARDKAHAKAALAAAGLPVLPGRVFFREGSRPGFDDPHRRPAEAKNYARALGYPIFCKPNGGARGDLAEIVASENALADYTARVLAAYDAFLVEPLAVGEEHRMLVKDGRALLATRKTAPQIIGDGQSTVGALLAAHNARLEQAGVSPIPLGIAPFAGAQADEVLGLGQRLALPGRRNLSAGGGAQPFEHAPRPLAKLAIAAARAMGLRIASVDMFDRSPASDGSDLMIIEVNGSPGLKSLELARGVATVVSLWADMLEEALAAAGDQQEQF